MKSISEALPALAAAFARHGRWPRSGGGWEAVLARLASGVFWNTAGAVLARGLGFGFTLLLARLLGKEAFGQYGILQSTVAVLAAFAGFGLGLTVTKYVAELWRGEPREAGRILAAATLFSGVAGLGGGLALLVLAGPLSWMMAGTGALTGSFQLSAPILGFSVVQGAWTGGLNGFEAFRTSARLHVAAALASFLLGLAGWYFARLPGVLIGLAAAQGLGCCWGWGALREEARKRGVEVRFAGCGRALGRVLAFGLPTLLATCLVSPVYWLGQAWLVRLDGLSAQAEYAVAAQWRGYLTFLPLLMSGAFLPVCSSLQRTGLRPRFILGSAGMAAGVALGVAAPGFIFAPEILALYGPGFAAGAWALRWLCVAAVADAANAVLIQVLLATGQPWLRLVSNSLWALIAIALVLRFLPAYGAAGLSLALAASQVLHLAVQVPLTLRAARSGRPMPPHA